MKRTRLAVGSLALVAMLGLMMVGHSVYAQTDATPDTSATPAVGGESSSSSTSNDNDSKRDAYLAALAENLGVSTDELQTAIDATNDELGYGGIMSGGQNGGRPGQGNNGPGNGAPGMGNNGPGRQSSLRDVDLADAAIFLAITEDQLKTEMQDNPSFLAIAAAHGKTSAEIRAFLIDQATAAIDERLQKAADAAASSDATETPATVVPSTTATATA